MVLLVLHMNLYVIFFIHCLLCLLYVLFYFVGMFFIHFYYNVEHFCMLWGAYVIVYCSYEIWIVFLSINYQNTSNEIFLNYNIWYCLLFLFLHLDSMVVVMMVCLLRRHHKSSKLCLFLTPLVFWRKTWSRKDDVDDGNNDTICILLVEPL